MNTMSMKDLYNNIKKIQIDINNLTEKFELLLPKFDMEDDIISIFVKEIQEVINSINIIDSECEWKNYLKQSVYIKQNTGINIRPNKLHTVFVIWCKDNNEMNRKISARKFYLDMKKKIPQVKSGGDLYYILR